MKKSILILSILVSSLLVLESCENQQSPSKKKVSQGQIIEQENNNISKEKNYLLIGKKLAIQTKESLGENLKQAIGTRGFSGAVEFCNIQAIPITDSVSKSLHAKIKRVSDKPRNKMNQAREGEIFYIDMCKQSLAEGKELKPFISEDENKMIAYYPIVTNQMCLNCHGSSKDIASETLAKINSLYPEDQATGYNENELRGLFVIEMDK